MYRSDYLIKIGQLRTRLATIVSGSDIMKKNQINRDLDEDTAGNDFEQKLLDSINRVSGGGNERAISEALKKRKKGKNSTSFSVTTKR